MREFITPLTFAALTGEKVVTDLFATASGDETLQSAIEHIEVARRTTFCSSLSPRRTCWPNSRTGWRTTFSRQAHLAYTGPVLIARR
ncbi:MAG: hypothetical protein R2748_22405 [Bryobacterales bacterium]